MHQRVRMGIVLLVLLLTNGGPGRAADIAARDGSGVWATVAGAMPPAISRRISGMTALAPADLWAVGWSTVTSAKGMTLAQPLIEHWDGSAWAALPVPTPPDRPAYLFAISGTGARDLWAVGSIAPDTDTTGNTTQPLALHYDGVTWTQVTLPAPPTQGTRASLVTVSALAPGDVWAAGWDGGAGIIRHWDGNAWQSIGAPNTSGVVRDAIGWNDMAAVSPRDLWLVGERQLGAFGANGIQPVVAHWDGLGWTLVDTPLPAGSQDRLTRIVARAANDVWAVGSAGTPPDWPTAAPDMRMHPFVVHWDGTQWTEAQVPAPDASATVTYLTAAVATARGDLWVSGTYGAKVALGDVLTESAQTFFLHGDGATWTVVPGPAPTKGGAMPFDTPAALATAGASDLWCGGQFQNGAASFLHYSG